MYKRLAFFLAFLTAFPAAAEDTVTDVVSGVIAAYGGDALPAEGEVLRQTGTNFSNRRGAEGAILREARWPDYLFVEIAYADGGRETRLLVGDDGLLDGAPAPGPMVLAMKLQAARMSLPMVLKWRESELIDLGPFADEAGRPVRRLALPLGDGLTLYVEIDDATRRVRRSAGVMNFGGAEMAFGAAYSEPTAFGGMTWDAREDQSAMGSDIGWTRLTSVERAAAPSRDSLRP